MEYVNEYIDLINDAEIKRYAPIAANVNAESLRPFMRTSQLNYIQPLLGTALYTELITNVSGSTTNADEDYMLTILKPALANYISYEALPFISAHISNKGTIHKQTETGVAIDPYAFKLIRDGLLKTAEINLRLLKDYLETDSKLASPKHPLYRSCDSTGDSDIFFSGIEFGC